MNISTPYRKKLLRFISIFLLCLSLSAFFINKNNVIAESSDEICEDDIKNCVKNLFQIRNKAILTKDLDSIESLYDTDNKFGQWAYEYEEKKIKYINNWAEKQGVQFIDIIPNIIIRKATPSKDKDRYSFYVLCNTEYKYIYPDEPDKINSSRIGTYHSLTLKNINNDWIVSKEWYTDPFADSLNLENIKVDSIKEYIKTQPPRDFSNLNERRVNAIKYAKMYCGAATEPEYGYKYNKKYRNFNCEGGDCANFASQILHEGGKFKETSKWVYDKGSASGPWINADKFTYYMLNSGRASVIAKGSYEKVYKASYKLLPGDFVAYENKGDITHISVVSGADSKGYSLVTCHNTDRNDVPWDLGWSDKKIKFWLIHVNY
ncbi:MAG TPA: amidase domain-containing protein [Clostridium sp.]|nr:amidase domain-containing protein [Clostridium sp.]